MINELPNKEHEAVAGSLGVSVSHNNLVSPTTLATNMSVQEREANAGSADVYNGMNNTIAPHKPVNEHEAFAGSTHKCGSNKNRDKWSHNVHINSRNATFIAYLYSVCSSNVLSHNCMPKYIDIYSDQDVSINTLSDTEPLHMIAAHTSANEHEANAGSADICSNNRTDSMKEITSSPHLDAVSVGIKYGNPDDNMPYAHNNINSIDIHATDQCTDMSQGEG